MKQKILVTLLIIETVILAFVLLGKGASENKIAQNLGENNTNTSWDVSGETEIFREESPAENAGLSEDRENVVTVDEKRVIQEQSFNIELEEWGNVRFVSYLPSDEVYMEDVSFLLTKENQVIYSFPYYCENNTTENYVGLFDSVEAVGFQDIDGDNEKDVIVIINYVTGAGPQGMLPRKTVRIFRASDSGFTILEELMSDVMENIEESDLSISTIYEYIESN